MITKEQVEAVKKITSIKNQILRSNNWDEIVELGNQAINIAIPIPANNDLSPDTLYGTRSKLRQITNLEKELNWVKVRSYPDLETVHFQIAASLLMLSLSFVKNMDNVDKIAA
jgi:hypothetical protein